MARLIKRGEFWIVDLEPGFGREIHKKRPALIISNNDINNTHHVIVIPSSSMVPAVHTAEIIGLHKPKGFSEESVLVPIFIRSIDQDRLVKKVGTISKNKMQEVEEVLKIVLGFNYDNN